MWRRLAGQGRQKLGHTARVIRDSARAAKSPSFILYKMQCFRHVKDDFDWKPFLAALGLAILLEGLVWALAPDAMRRAVILIAQMPKSSIRVLGLAALALGLFLVWLARSA